MYVCVYMYIHMYMEGLRPSSELLPSPVLSTPRSPDHRAGVEEERGGGQGRRACRTCPHAPLEGGLLSEQGFLPWGPGLLSVLPPGPVFRGDVCGVAEASAPPPTATPTSGRRQIRQRALSHLLETNATLVFCTSSVRVRVCAIIYV